MVTLEDTKPSTYTYSIHNQEIQTQIELSPSVVQALRNLKSLPSPYSAIEIIREIIKSHKELAKGEGIELINKVVQDATKEPSYDPLTVTVSLGQRKEVREWIEDVIAVYIKEKDKVPLLHVKLIRYRSLSHRPKYRYQTTCKRFF